VNDVSFQAAQQRAAETKFEGDRVLASRERQFGPDHANTVATTRGLAELAAAPDAPAT